MVRKDEMKSAEEIANFCEAQIAERLSHFNDSEILRFTPSIKYGRRFVGMKIGDQEFLVEINVTEA